MKDVTMKTEQWRAAIISFESRAEFSNPFLDVSITAKFTGPSGKVISREAYWDGGKTYRVSFAPTETGCWKYILSAPEETGLNDMNGELECLPYTGNLDIYKHGFLKVGASSRYLTYADGKPFFWLGDTHWAFAFGEKWDWSNHPKMDSMFKGMADKRAEQGYTVYQTNLRSESWRETKSRYWEGEEPGILPAVEFYQNELDRRMQYLADLGLVNALGFAWSGAVLGKIQLQKNLARYIVARYGALPVVWTLAGEVAGYSGGENRKACIDGWREVALYVEQLDGYGTLQTAHYTNERPFASYYQNEDWYDFTLNQAGHGDFPISPKYFREYRMEYPSKPFVEGESLYEFCSTLEENGSRLCTADMTRRVAYMSIQMGGCGYTYGAQGIWDVMYEKPKQDQPNFSNIFNAFGIAWYEAIDGEGGRQMGYMRRFYEDVHFWELTPSKDIKSAMFGMMSDEIAFGRYAPAMTANADKSRLVLYYYPTTAGENTIVGLKDAEYRADWFDPRTGEYIVQSESFVPKEGTWTIPGRPGNGDWLLFVRCI